MIPNELKERVYEFCDRVDAIHPVTPKEFVVVLERMEALGLISKSQPTEDEIESR